ncbi:MAG: galactokinase [Candidatus Coproplasma sp.]
MSEIKYDYKVTAAGRVNIIGEHVDYCGGKVLPAALSLKNTVYIRPNGTNKINVRWTTLPDEVTLDIDKLESYKDLKYGNYQAGSALMWQRAGHKIVGCDMLQDCTVPFGSGLSSSAAIEVSTIAALAVVAGEEFDPVDVALTAQQAEREYAGVNCGIMDQYASACGKVNHAILLDCKTLEREYVPVSLGDYSLVIINSNKPHNLVESKYNERRSETEEALETLKKYVDIDCLADLNPEEFAHYSHVLSGKVKDRATHVINECDRVRLAVEAMRAGNIEFLGLLLNKSHESLSKLYEVTGRELDALAAAAQEHPACVGSRMTGAGFGGCTISLVKSSAVEDFKKYVCAKYEEATGYNAKCYQADIADGITVEKL